MSTARRDFCSAIINHLIEWTHSRTVVINIGLLDDAGLGWTKHGWTLRNLLFYTTIYTKQHICSTIQILNLLEDLEWDNNKTNSNQTTNIKSCLL